jgi:hypothetical protein
MVQVTSNVPTAHVTVNRNRLKFYGSEVFLKSGTNFEVELWNPLTTRVMATVTMNGVSVGNSLVINPGQRVYLERWVNEPKKFLFTTYEVENTPEAAAAISLNGEVRVNFYTETIAPVYPVYRAYYTNCFSSTSTSSSTYDAGPYAVPLAASCTTSAVETGRTDKGGHSSQDFSDTSGNFSTYAISTSMWKILPESKKPVETDKLRSYCTSCGTRVRSSSWKFCSSCGEKL